MDYLKEASFAVTICDANGNILSMNDKSRATFADAGDLIGHSLLDCHPEPARSKLIGMLHNHNINAYTIEKNGQHKLIYQTPWFDNGNFGGYIELSIVLPEKMPHYVRKPKESK